VRSKFEEVIRQSVAQMSEHLKDAMNLSQQGMATDADIMKVQVQLSDIKSETTLKLENGGSAGINGAEQFHEKFS